ncbi:hypothetical protein [Labrys sp. 22185]|uniref:hypothetical protein n=1 Tax=Labrys sp. 22185 TaxID=3453888 RepID=UPI003F84784E
MTISSTVTNPPESKIREIDVVATDRRIDGAFAGDGVPFIYEPMRGSSGVSPWFSEVRGQPASTPASDALQGFFDGWINTLASWTLSGSATIGQHHDLFQSGLLASSGGSEPTHGGWGSSPR